MSDASDPNSTFHCQYLRGTMRRAVCVGRQEARFERGGPVYPHCGSGQCEEGKLVKLGLGDWKPKPFRELRADWKQQKATRLRLQGRKY